VILDVPGEALRVAWADMRYIRRNLPSVLMTIVVTPLLYFVAFGYGLGDRMGEVDGVPYIAFVIPGIISLSALTSSFSVTANKIMVQRKFYASFDEIMLCPISPAGVVLGKSAIGLVRAVMRSAILLVMGLLMSSEMRLTPMLVFSVLLSCLTFSLLGVIGGLVARDMSSTTTFSTLIITPMTFLCGTVFPLDAMPGPVRAVIDVLPLTHTTACIRSAALGQQFPYSSLAIVLVTTALFFAVSYLMVKWRKV